MQFAFDNKINIQNYIKDFVKIEKPKKTKGIPLNSKIEIEGDVVDEEHEWSNRE